MEPVSCLAAGIAIGMSGLAAAYAEAHIGAAAVGAIAEDKEFFSKGLILTIIPETIVVFGFVIAVMILMG